MIGRSALTSLVIALSALVFLSGTVVAQQTSLTEQLIGTWTLSSFYRECPDGNKSDVLGPNPQGLRIFQRDGRMSNFVMRSDLPKFTSTARRRAPRTKTRQ